MLLGAELRYTEWQLTRSSMLNGVLSAQLRYVVVAHTDHLLMRQVFGALLRCWRGAKEAKRWAAHDQTQRERDAAAEGVKCNARWAARARVRCAELMADRLCCRQLATVMKCWHSAARAARQHRAAEASKEAQHRRDAEVERALSAATEKVLVAENRLAQTCAALQQEVERRRVLQAESTELSKRLVASEAAVQQEIARAAQADEETQRLEVELQACELKLLMLDAQAIQEAEDIHNQLKDTLVSTPKRRG